MKNQRFGLLLIGLLGLLSTACQQFENVPPNDIGMMLTPTGYEDKVYTPGQIDIGRKNNDGRANQLVLLQRSGIEVKEPFSNADASKDDKEDHRCLSGEKEPFTLDVRLLFALPDYETPQGRKDLARVFMLGNPQPIEGKDRILRISAESVYVEQARNQVRGRIRQICTKYMDFDAAFTAFADEGENGFSRSIEREVAQILVDKNVPLRLVNAFVSNMKPDPAVVDAIAAQRAAVKRVEAIRTITEFLNEDRSGSRWVVYNNQVMQEIVATGNNNGHNTIIFTERGKTPQVLPLQVSPRPGGP